MKKSRLEKLFGIYYDEVRRQHREIEHLHRLNANQASSIALLQDEAKAYAAEQHDDHITIEALRADLDGTTTQLVQLRKSYEELQHRFNKREDVRMEQVIKDGGFSFTAPFEGF